VTAYSLGRLSLLAALLQASTGHAQVSTHITSSGLGTSIGPPTAGVYDITGGTRPGNGPNLFHSLGAFSVGAGDVANFKNDSGLFTSNIIGRVTGGQTSNIYGTISTTGFTNADLSTANLFLINPAGWVFGASAALQVEGSFHASTAHYVRFADGAQFFADPNQASVLTSASPVAFGFLGPTAPIVVDGSFLQVAPGQTLSLVGGDVQIGGTAYLFAPSGRIQIGSFTSAGEANVDGLNGAFSNLGRIDITGSTLDVSAYDINQTPLATPAGSVVIRGGQLFMDGGTILSNNFGDIDAGTIDLSLAQSVSLSNASNVGSVASADFGVGLGRGGDVHVSAPQVNIDGSFVLSQTFGAGPAGGVSIQASTLTVTGGGTVASATLGDGHGGDVNINATQSVSISGHDSASNPSSIATQTTSFGDGGRLTVSTPSLMMFDGGSIVTAASGGRGGDLMVTVDQLSMNSGATIKSHNGLNAPSGNISISATGPVALSGNLSGIFSDTCPTCASSAGDISVNAKSITVTNGALIQSGSNTNPQGGSVTLSGSDSIMVSAQSGISTQAQDRDVGPITLTTPMLLLNNGYVSASTLGGGHGGSITLQVGTLTLTHGGQIASSTQRQASGNGGDITISANSISISGTSPTPGPSTPFNTIPNSGIFSTAQSSGNGNAGQIRIATPMLSMADGGTISVATSTGGAAGNVAFKVGNLSMSNGATVNSSTSASGAGGAIAVNASSATIAGVGTGLFSTASKAGNAGQITLSGGNTTVADGGRISVTTAGAGNAGTITANVGSMMVSGGQLDSSTSASGAGGSINVAAGSEASVVNGGRISADSTGAGRTGNVVVAAGDRITMNGGSISTHALTSDGGDITLKAPVIVRLENSQITTSVQSGHGAGGNVLIDPQFLVMNNSSITANAFGGPGGNITIIADNFLASSTALLQASSALSTPGSIQIVSPENNVAGSIAQLPRAFVDASRLLRGACSARREGAPSSFVLAGRGGVPAEADGYLPSTIAAAPPAALALAYLDDCAR
jgi:filamentous hemagglutinin family protein